MRAKVRANERASETSSAEQAIEWSERANKLTSEGTSGRACGPSTLCVDFVVIPPKAYRLHARVWDLCPWRLGVECRQAMMDHLAGETGDSLKKNLFYIPF